MARVPGQETMGLGACVPGPSVLDHANRHCQGKTGLAVVPRRSRARVVPSLVVKRVGRLGFTTNRQVPPDAAVEGDVANRAWRKITHPVRVLMPTPGLRAGVPLWGDPQEADPGADDVPGCSLLLDPVPELVIKVLAGRPGGHQVAQGHLSAAGRQALGGEPVCGQVTAQPGTVLGGDAGALHPVQRQGEPVQPVQVGRVVQDPAEQVEDAVRRSSDEVQVTVGTAGQDLGRALHKLVRVGETVLVPLVCPKRFLVVRHRVGEFPDERSDPVATGEIPSKGPAEVEVFHGLRSKHPEQGAAKEFSSTCGRFSPT